jgi:hypothetical protein
MVYGSGAILLQMDGLYGLPDPAIYMVIIAPASMTTWLAEQFAVWCGKTICIRVELFETSQAYSEPI